MYHVLQEFMTATKGMCYVLSFGLLVIFVPFWLFLSEREKDDTSLPDKDEH